MNIKTKTYEEHGKKYKFSSSQMKAYINKKKMSQKNQGVRITNNEIMNEIAEDLMTSSEAVKNWMYAYNAPGDLEQIKSIGAYFNVDYHVFLEAEETDMSFVEKESYQELKTKERVREIYLLVLNLIRLLRKAWQHYCTDEIGKEPVDILLSMVNLIKRKLEDYDLDLPIVFKENVYNYVAVDLMEDYIVDMLVSSVEGSLAYDEGEENDNLKGYSAYDVEELEKAFEKHKEESKRYLDYGYKEDLNRIFSDYKLDHGILKTNMEENYGGERND